MAKLKRSFFLRSDVVLISRQLIGKHLFTRLNGDPLTGGIIVETEAYAGPEDRASHAYGNRRTKRTEIMFHAGGVAYVYMCYGIHYLLNIVTNVADTPHAVLIRAIEPTHGVETILRRRGKTRLDKTVANGPGSLAKALGIDLRYNGMSLTGSKIWLEDRGYKVRRNEIDVAPRIGVSYAGPDAERPWRFRLRDQD